MNLFNLKNSPQEPTAESIQDNISTFSLQPEAPQNDELSDTVKPSAPFSVEEKAKKKSILSMDVKDLIQLLKKSSKESDSIPVEYSDEQPKEKKSLLTMDLKDLAKMKPQAKKKSIKLSKKTMNFVHHQSDFNLLKVLPAVVVVAAALSVFVKIGFLDMLDQKTAAYSQLATKQEQLAAVNTRLVGYDELAAQYGRYSYGWMSASEIGTVNRLDVMDLIEQEIAPYAKMENFAVNNNVLTTNVYGITLENASTMVKRLEEHPLVESASVYSASAEDGVEARIFLSINLSKEAA